MLTEPPSILISDDDLPFRQTLEEMLIPQGYRILLAVDGEQALNIVQQEEVHLVVTDMNMPRLSGLDMIRRVREFKKTLPCILLSAEAEPWLVEQARREQVYSVLAKPFRRRQICTAVSEALQWAYDWQPKLPRN